MNLKLLLVVVPAALFILGSVAAIARHNIDDAGALACVNDKWVETEPTSAADA